MLNALAIKIGASTLAIVAAFGLGWKICSWKNDSQYKDAYSKLQQQYVNLQQQYNDLMDKNKLLYDSLNDLKIKNQKRINELNGQLQKEIKAHPQYSSNIVPDSGVQFYNATINSANQAKPTK